MYFPLCLRTKIQRVLANLKYAHWDIYVLAVAGESSMALVADRSIMVASVRDGGPSLVDE